MSTRLTMLGWSTTGLRCPDHELDFTNSDSSVYQVSLIQMPNGTGKTTTLELLRATLSGQAESWDSSRVRAYRKHNSDTENGRFQVNMMCNGVRLTIVLNLNFEEGRAKYTTTWKTGQENSFSPPRELQQFLSEDFVDFFVFDGELAQNLLDSKMTDAQRAIESLFRLSVLTTIKGRVEDHWKQAVAGKTAKGERGKTRRQNHVEYLEQHLQKLRSTKDELTNSVSSKSKELETLVNRFDEQINKKKDVETKLTDAKINLSKAESAVINESSKTLERMRNPQALSMLFTEQIIDLRNSLDRVKLPESAGREFFEELADEESCVCGREMTDEASLNIRQHSKNYFGTEDVALLNAMKSDIAQYVDGDPTEQSRALHGSLVALSDAIDLSDEAKNELDWLSSQAIKGDPALEEAQKNIRELDIACRDQVKELEKFDESIDLGDERSDIDKTNGIKLIESKLEKAERSLAEISETIDLKRRTTILTNILMATHEHAKQLLGKHLVDEANDRIGKIMPHNEIHINEIDQCLVLNSRDGGSVGETLSIAFAFLSTLFNRSEYQLPFIVDSPAGPIDLAIRPKIARLIPQLTKQFVAFTISTERDGFVTPIKASCNNDIQFLTLFRKGAAPYSKADSPVETEDGVLIENGSYFGAFQVESEEE